MLCRSIIREVPILIQGTRRLSRDAQTIRQVMIVGAGLTGSSIAELSIFHGYQTWIVDRNIAVVTNAVKRIETQLLRLLCKEMSSTDRAEARIADVMKRLKRGIDPLDAGMTSSFFFSLFFT